MVNTEKPRAEMKTSDTIGENLQTRSSGTVLRFQKLLRGRSKSLKFEALTLKYNNQEKCLKLRWNFKVPNTVVGTCRTW